MFPSEKVQVTQQVKTKYHIFEIYTFNLIVEVLYKLQLNFKMHEYQDQDWIMITSSSHWRNNYRQP